MSKLTIRAAGHGRATEIYIDGQQVHRVRSINVRMSVDAPNTVTIEQVVDEIEIDGIAEAHIHEVAA